MSRISFFQVNLHHCKEASANLENLLAHCPHSYLALIQEPYIFKNRVIGVPKQANLFQGVSVGQVTRACIIASKSLNAFHMHNLSDPDCTTVMLNLKLKDLYLDILIVSSYMPGDMDSPPPGMIRQVVNYSVTHKASLLIGCDCNAHHRHLWGSTDINKRGLDLGDYLLSNNLNVCNIGTTPTFVVANRKEVLDITICNNSVINYIDNWRVSDTPSLSDHRIIEFNLKTNVNSIFCFRNIRNTNWEKFQQTLDNSDLSRLQQDEISMTENIEAVAVKLNSHLNNAFSKSTAITRVGPKRKPVWWNNELKALRHQVKIYFNMYILDNSDLAWERFWLVRKRYKHEIRQAKCTSWREFCSQICSMPASHRLNRCLKGDHQCKIGQIRQKDGSLTHTLRHSIGVLLGTHFAGAYDISNLQPSNTDLIHVKENTPSSLITKEKIYRAWIYLDSTRPLGLMASILLFSLRLLIISTSCLSLTTTTRSYV